MSGIARAMLLGEVKAPTPRSALGCSVLRAAFHPKRQGLPTFSKSGFEVNDWGALVAAAEFERDYLMPDGPPLQVAAAAPSLIGALTKRQA